MKKIIILFFLCSIIQAKAGQTVEESSSGNLSLSKITHRQDGLILNFTSDGWLTLPANITTKPLSSRGFAFYLMGEKMTPKGNIGLGYGLGISSMNVSSNGFFDDCTNSDKTLLHAYPDSIDYDINKISLNYLDLALELRFRTNENESHKRFKFSLGAKGGWLFQDHMKFKNGKDKSKVYNLDHLNDFQYGLTARIGYGKWALNGYYGLAGIFEKNKGPELIPFSVGISITP
ncbi:MAG: PorT family protein [Bacteroidetes bacterium]|nr:PorT family protein [Bacteroidota bacterium]